MRDSCDGSYDLKCDGLNMEHEIEDASINTNNSNQWYFGTAYGPMTIKAVYS